MGELASINLSKEIIEPIVREQLQASIVAALGKSEQLIAGVVQTILNTQVDREGKRGSGYGYNHTLIQWMAEDAIKEAAKEAIKEWFAANRETLKKDIKRALTDNRAMMAEQYVMGLCEHAQNSGITVSVSVGKK